MPTLNVVDWVRLDRFRHVCVCLAGWLVIGCSSDNLPKIVDNPNVRVETPKSNEEWQQWKLAREKAKDGTLCRMANVWVTKAGDKGDRQTAVEYEVRVGEEFDVWAEFELNHGLTALPREACTVYVTVGQRVWANKSAELLPLGSSKFGVKSKLKLETIPLGTYTLLLLVLGEKSATAKLVVR